ncbi:polysaccharide deacetylase family protein [Antarcticibacterium sp. W02-3]|nr:polysaccharide deacetylase family protein [Antarcticibacterium sp. W02-3]
MPGEQKTLYLTFDDGPIPGITPWVLSLLKDYNAKATFFCIGENVKKYPEIFKAILAEGHSIGNHTHNHLNGWKTSTDIYIENVLRAGKIIQQNLLTGSSEHPSHPPKKNQESTASPYTQPTTHNRQPTTHNRQPTTENRKLFRPPFGKITPGQMKKVKKLGYEIVMWEIVSEDYDNNKNFEYCYDQVISQAGPGSIIVFHDSIKASGNLKKILPGILEYFKNKGYNFKAL